MPPWEEYLADDSDAGPLLDSLRKLSRSSQCPLASLPENLTVGGNLQLKGCHSISALPERRHLGGDVSIESCCQFRRLPTDLEIAGNLTLKGCPNLTELPARLRVSGDVRLIAVPITQLPRELEVRGSLVLESYRRVPQLPKGLEIGKDLIVRCCLDADVPEDLRVGRHLIFDRCGGTVELPKSTSVGGNIIFRRCDGLVALPAGLQVRKSLKLTYCRNLRELPDQLGVPDTLDLQGCSAITHLPSGLRVGYARRLPTQRPVLIVSDCTALRELPRNLIVHGPIDVAGAGVQDLPKTLAGRCQLAWRGMIVPADFVFHPETLPPARILEERNVELRRVMMERVGFENVLRKTGATIIDEDTDPGGVRRLVKLSIAHRQHYFLHCRCPSTGREYLLRVPPSARTCRAAAAWLAGFDNPDDYHPLKET